MPIVKSSGAVSPAARATASRQPLVMPPDRRGQHDREDRAPLAAAERQARLAQVVGHELEHLLGRADDDRQHEAGQRERTGEAGLALPNASTQTV